MFGISALDISEKDDKWEATFLVVCFPVLSVGGGFVLFAYQVLAVNSVCARQRA